MYSQSFPTSDTAATKLISFRDHSKVWLKNLLVTLVGLFAGLIISEIVLAFLKPPPIRWYDPQPLHLPDKELGWIMKPNQHSYTHDKPVVTNALGLRSPEIGFQKEPRALRILCLGDSQTFGNGVAQEETYAARLQSILRSRMPDRTIEVINAGVAGYDTVQEVKLLERILSSVKPDIVTIGFYLNDIVEVTQPKNRYVINATTGEFQRTGLLKQFTPYRLIYLLKRSRVVTYVHSQYGARRMTAEGNITKAVLRGRTPAALEPSWAIIKNSLLTAENLGKAHGFRLIAFPIPAVQEFLDDFPHEQYRSRFLDLAKNLGLDRIDPTPQMKATGNEINRYFVQWDGHINPATHKLIAELLSNKVLTSARHDS